MRGVGNGERRNESFFASFLSRRDEEKREKEYNNTGIYCHCYYYYCC